jgi:hypothetical protein
MVLVQEGVDGADAGWCIWCWCRRVQMVLKQEGVRKWCGFRLVKQLLVKEGVVGAGVGWRCSCW